MNHRSSVVSLCLFVAIASPLAFADQLPVINPGFEDPSLAACAFNSSIPGWTVTGGGVWRPLPCWSQDYPAGSPEGLQVGYSNNSDISQVLTSTLAPLVEYTLSVQVGRRGSCCPMQSYKVQLKAGGTLLAEDPGLLNPAPGTFMTSIVTFVAGTDHPALGQPLEIRLVRSGTGQNNFDDVHLTTTTADCNNNGIPDATDIANGTSQDVNGNGLPDECETLCPADIAPAPGGNGVVNAGDLLAVINAWGPCGSGSCPADIAPSGGDGFVNAADLLAVINHWGPCP